MNTQTGKCYGVIDPGHADAPLWREAFGSDCVELLTGRTWEIGGSRFLRVAVGSLGEAGLIRACRVVARMCDESFDYCYSEAVQGSGISLRADGVFLCEDPEDGRRHWKPPVD